MPLRARTAFQAVPAPRPVRLPYDAYMRYSIYFTTKKGILPAGPNDEGKYFVTKCIEDTATVAERNGYCPFFFNGVFLRFDRMVFPGTRIDSWNLVKWIMQLSIQDQKWRT